MRSPKHRVSLPILALMACLAVIASCVAVVVLRELMSLPDVPQVAARPHPGAPLTHKLVFVVADALRYDYATDEQRAPNIARHMRTDAHGELWAGRISMTSSSILALGTGQRGDFAEVITNLHAGRTRFDDFVNSARRSGLTTGLVGDVVWTQLFDHFDPEKNDDAAMAIDVDNSPEMLAASREILGSGHAPDILVLHFIATDHQGHAYGMASQRYADFLRRFDAELQALLDEVPAGTTVLFMSDHGATDTGAHGSDIPIARRSPFFAYGPGIRRGVDLGAMDQVDIGPTVTALMGIPSPLHARGTVLTELLDLPAEQASVLACADATRAIDNARARGMNDVAGQMQQVRSACDRSGTTPEARIASSREAVRALDAAMESASSTRGLRGALLLSGALGVLLACLALVMRKVRPAPASLASPAFPALAMLLCLVSTALTLEVERIPSPWHNVARFVLFFASGVLLLIALLRPHVGVQWYARRPSLAWVLLPGALAWSYTPNTQAMSMIVLVVGSLVVVLGSDAERRRGWLARGIRLGDGKDALMLLAALACLLPFGFRTGEPLPAWLGTRPTLLVAVSAFAASGWLLFASRKSNPRVDAWQTALAIGIPVASLLLRRMAPSWLGLGCIIGLPVLCMLTWKHGMQILAIGSGLGAWLWVSRDEEVLAVVAALAAAEILGRLIAGRCDENGTPRPNALTSSPWMAALTVTLLFCLAFLMRVGLQCGLDFTSMDFGAGSFGDPQASSLRIVLSLIWKYLGAELLLLLVFLRWASRRDRRATLLAFVAVSAIRAVTIALMLFACRTSYWTAFRTLSDAGPAMATAIAGGILLVAWGAGLGSRKVREHAQTQGPMDQGLHAAWE